MRVYRATWVLAIALLFTASALAEEVAAQNRIATCIGNLGHERFAVRDRAARDLVRIGQPALKPLRAVLASHDLEIRKRADALIKTIEAQTLNAELIKAPTLHLKYDKVPLQDALADLNKKTCLQMLLDPKSKKNPRVPITLDTGDVPFWEAVQQFHQATGVMESPVAEVLPFPGNGIGYTGGFGGAGGFGGNGFGGFGGNNGFGNGFGGSLGFQAQPYQPPDFRFRLIDCKLPLTASTGSIVRVKALPKETPGGSAIKGSNRITFVLDVTPAPAMAWQGLVNVDIHRAIDERGRSLEQSHIEGDKLFADEVWDYIQGQFIVQGKNQIFIQGQFGGLVDGQAAEAISPINPRHVPITLLGKDSPSTMLKELKGVVRGQVLTPPRELLTIDNILTASTTETISSGPFRLRITERTDPKSTFGFTMRFRLETPAQNDVHKFPVRFRGRLQPFIQIDNGSHPANVQPQIAFFDAGGKEIKKASHTPSLTLSLMGESFDGTNCAWDYHVSLHRDQKTDEPVSLVLTGRKSVCVEVPFALKNVPLP